MIHDCYHYSFRLYAYQTRNSCTPTPHPDPHPDVHVRFLFPGLGRGPVLFLVYTLFYYLKLLTEFSDQKSPVDPRMRMLEN